MANYENGLETKTKILETCKELFYNRGFAKTTFKDIGQSADVDQGLIVNFFDDEYIQDTTLQEGLLTKRHRLMRSWNVLLQNVDSICKNGDNLLKLH